MINVFFNFYSKQYHFIYIKKTSLCPKTTMFHVKKNSRDLGRLTDSSIDLLNSTPEALYQVRGLSGSCKDDHPMSCSRTNA